jgi:hypothetical protein
MAFPILLLSAVSAVTVEVKGSDYHMLLSIRRGFSDMNILAPFLLMKRIIDQIACFDQTP